MDGSLIGEGQFFGKFWMFKKWKPENVKNHSVLKNSIVAKVKENSVARIPKISYIIDDLFPKKTQVFIYNLQDHVKFYVVDGKPILIELGYGEIFPFLYVSMQYPGLLRPVIVFDGALEAILRGADLMARGTFGVDETYQKGEVVQVVLEGEESPFAIGIMDMDGNGILARSDGVGVRIMHTIKDGLWNSFI